MRTFLMAFLFVVAPLGREAAAQMFSYGSDRPRPIQSLAFVVQAIDFSHRGDSTPEPSFDYSGPAYGLVYTRPNFTASIAYGGDTGPTDRDLRMLNASIMTWGEVRLDRSSSRDRRLYVPITIHTNYRRVAPRGSENSIIDAFNVTVLGLGAGLGYSARFGKVLSIHARATPIIGLALRAFGNSAGTSRLLDSDLRLHLTNLAGRFGVSAGYGFRTQVWNVGASDLLQESGGDLFDYGGTQHVVSVGINW